MRKLRSFLFFILFFLIFGIPLCYSVCDQDSNTGVEYCLEVYPEENIFVEKTGTEFKVLQGSKLMFIVSVKNTKTTDIKLENIDVEITIKEAEKEYPRSFSLDKNLILCAKDKKCSYKWYRIPATWFEYKGYKDNLLYSKPEDYIIKNETGTKKFDLKVNDINFGEVIVNILTPTQFKQILSKEKKESKKESAHLIGSIVATGITGISLLFLKKLKSKRLIQALRSLFIISIFVLIYQIYLHFS